MQKKILSFGEIVWDIFENKKVLGGAPFNFTYFARKFNTDARILSAIGNDQNGKETLQFMSENDIPSDLVLKLDGIETGKVIVTIKDNSPSYEICSPSAWDYITVTPESIEFAANANAIAFGTLAQRNEVSRQNLFKIIRATSKKCLKVFDANLRQNFYTKEILTSSLEISNILKINDEELPIIAKMFSISGDKIESARAVFKMFNLSYLLLTCGKDGHIVICQDEVITGESKVRKLVNTVGAGDSFTASFVCEILNGESAKTATDRAATVAAQVCERQN